MITVARTATPQTFRTEREHLAWDCSSVPRRLANLSRHFRRHLDHGKDAQIRDDCILAMQSLVKVPAVALMLPMPLSDDAKQALLEIKEGGAEIDIAAETSFWGEPRMLYIVKTEGVDTQSPVAQLHQFLEMLAEATLPVKPRDGPWLWPLHEPDVAAALLVCQVMSDTECWFWRLLRSLRILTPFCLLEQQRHVKEQYAPSTSYVLAWMNQYTQGIWPLLAVCVPFAFIVEEEAERLDASSWEFYTLQVVVMLWAIVMIARARHRREFVQSYEAGESKTWVADLNKVAITKRQMLRRIMSQTGAGSEFASMVNLTQNPDFKKTAYHKPWLIWCVFLTVLGSLLCLVLAGLFLLVTMELKFSLIYEWGDCYKLGCHDPSNKHGFAGVLSMIGCDILLALTLNVATGELCKAFAYRIAKTWNFRSMILRQFVEHFTAMFIDIIATIGMFSYLAFSFLPEWEQTVPREWDDSSGCDIFWDYQACRVVRSCAPDDLTCCTGTLFCARSKLNFQQRREVFYAWLGGLFVVAPFVEILMLFIVPLVAYVIHVQVEIIRQSDDDEDPPSRGCSLCSCCCGFLRGLGRLVAFIFLLDGAVLGLPYIWKGFPFKDPVIVEEDDKSKAFGPYCTDCKRDMHWTDRDQEAGWKCRHHDVCQCSSENRGAHRWHCPTCHADICGDCHPQGAAVIGGLFGPLDQRLLRPMDPLDELKLLKMNFLVMVMFTPMHPIALIFQMLARQLDLHSRLPKLLMVRRRSFPTDNRLAHASQNLFGLLILPFAALWHTGLSLVSNNVELHTHSLYEIVFTWAGVGLGIGAGALVMQWLITRWFFRIRGMTAMMSRESSAIVGLEKEELEIEEAEMSAAKEEEEAQSGGLAL